MTEPTFATVSDLEDLLQVPITTEVQIASAERALREATAAVQNYCRQVLFRVAGDPVLLDGPGRARLLLPELPVISVEKVVENGVELVQGVDYLLGNHGLLVRVGRVWPAGVRNVAVTYTHGYADPLPEDLRGVCARVASRVYQAGLRAAETLGVSGVSSKTIGDFSVSFTAESGGGTGEGTMGVSSARLLLRSEMAILDRYRV